MLGTFGPVRRFAPVLLLIAVVSPACGAGQLPTVEGAGGETAAAVPAAGAAPAAPAGGAAATPVAPAEEATPTTEAPPPPPPSARSVTEQAWVPMAVVGDVTLVHPSDRVERVAFHQSNHEGARELTALPTTVMSTVLESRERLSAGQSAADVVVDPESAIRAPVSGRVLRAGSYVLYCKYRDDFVVIEPDGRPGWEVKILHIDGEQVDVGQRVEAGVTQLARRATQLPFESQVDKLRTADPAWPHVHIEVVDPSIPNIPSPGGGGGC